MARPPRAPPRRSDLLSKHVLVSGFEITARAWVGDTEDDSLAPIAGQPFSVRPHDLESFATQVWPRELEKLKASLSLAELQEAERLAVAELQAITAAEAAKKAAKPPRASRAKKAPAKKAAPAKRASKAAAAEEAALRSRTYQDPGETTT